jgi:hypothetical protein
MFVNAGSGSVMRGTAMDHDTEIRALAAETLATQIVLGQVLSRIRGIDPRIAEAVAQAFDDAANIVEGVAIQMSTVGPTHAVKALQIVEELRTMVVGSGKKPKHGI